MSTISFNRQRFDVAYFCPHSKTHYFPKINGENYQVSFLFFTVIRTYYTDIIYCCVSCHCEVRRKFRYWEEAVDFVCYFQRCF